MGRRRLANRLTSAEAQVGGRSVIRVALQVAAAVTAAEDRPVCRLSARGGCTLIGEGVLWPENRAARTG